jgi:hypothetical protein
MGTAFSVTFDLTEGKAGNASLVSEAIESMLRCDSLAEKDESLAKVRVTGELGADVTDELYMAVAGLGRESHRGEIGGEGIR